MPRKTHYPTGWNAERVRRILEYYRNQTDEEAVAEDEAAYENPAFTMMSVPVELVPAVRDLIEKHQKRGRHTWS